MTPRRAPCTVYIRSSDADVSALSALSSAEHPISHSLAGLRQELPSILQETAMQSVLDHCPSAPARHPCLEWGATTSTLERKRWKRIGHNEESLLLMHQSYSTTIAMVSEVNDCDSADAVALVKI